MQALRSCLRARIPITFRSLFLTQIHKSMVFRNKVRVKGYVGVSHRLTSSLNNAPEECVDAATFEKVCEDTLESLTEYFEEIIEESENLKAADISYSTGVLTINLGPRYGTYVINRQTPNRQIWLSSPTSGPKRYDFDLKGNCWLYKHDGQSLHELLQNEISKIAEMHVNFGNCQYSRLAQINRP